MSKPSSLNIVILGLSITSSWGNGHATTYRGLVRELSRMGHAVTFLERDVEWYAKNRDMVSPEYCQLELYSSLDELATKYNKMIESADLVIVGSYVPEGVQVGQFVIDHASGITAFYDIDTPVTMTKLAKKDFEYLSDDLIQQYDLYLSFTGGPFLTSIEEKYNSPCAKPLYCSFDPDLYYPENKDKKYNLGYLGTYSADRQPTLEKLLIDPAKLRQRYKFIVAGPQFPDNIVWQDNVERVHHLAPGEHRDFYNSQKFTLNVTRADMIKAGYSPSVRLFEAAACGVPIISDYWKGIEEFFNPGSEILIAHTSEDVLNYLDNITDEKRNYLSEQARKKVNEKHTAKHRAEELITYYEEATVTVSKMP